MKFLPPMTESDADRLAVLLGHAINANNGANSLIEDALCKATTLCVDYVRLLRRRNDDNRPRGYECEGD